MSEEEYTRIRMQARDHEMVTFNEVAALDIWEIFMHQYLRETYPRWDLMRINKLGGLCAGFRANADRTIRRHVEIAIESTLTDAAGGRLNRQ